MLASKEPFTDNLRLSRLDIEASALQVEFDALCRIVQAQSVIQLLSNVGKTTQPDELEHFIGCVDHWIDQVESSLAEKSKGNALAAETFSLVAAFDMVQVDLRHAICSSGTVRDLRRALAILRSTHDRFSRLFAVTSLELSFFSNACASEFGQLMALRSE